LNLKDHFQDALSAELKISHQTRQEQIFLFLISNKVFNFFSQSCIPGTQSRGRQIYKKKILKKDLTFGQ